MANVTTADIAAAGREDTSRPYAPSWVDHLTARVDRLAGPGWLYYLGLGLFLLLVQAASLWAEGAYPIGTFLPAHLFFAGLMPFLLALLDHLDKRAGSALARVRPILRVTEEQYNQLYYQLTTLPARPMLLASLTVPTVFTLIGERLGYPSSFQTAAISPISAALMSIMYFVTWSVFTALLYHTLHQARVVHRIYCRHTCINLFKMRPSCVFSTVTALTAVGLTVGPYSFLALNPDLLFDVIGMGPIVTITVLAIAAFAGPMLGIHRVLVEEKERLLDECLLRLEAAIVELHRRMDDGEFEGMEAFSCAMASLEVEQNALKGIPTWPWQPETVRLLVTALALPLGVWILQYVLQLLLAL